MPLEATVAAKGPQQRIRVYDRTGVLPEGTMLSAEYMDSAHGDHNFFVEHTDPTQGVELQHFYNLTLTSGGKSLSQLDAPVELCFEVLDGLDKGELEVVLVKEFDDAEFEENLVDLDGASWVKVKTDHFSPYALIDTLSPEEKAALGQDNVKTGDHAVQVAVTGLGMVLVLALGVMLRLITGKKKFEE